MIRLGSRPRSRQRLVRRWAVLIVALGGSVFSGALPAVAQSDSSLGAVSTVTVGTVIAPLDGTTTIVPAASPPVIASPVTSPPVNVPPVITSPVTSSVTPPAIQPADPTYGGQVPLAPTSTFSLTGPFLMSTRKLAVGSRGDDVLALEQRLRALRYEVGKIDSRFDSDTWQGVVAFQKVHGLKRTGRVSDDVQSAINAARAPRGLLPNGGAQRVEVDISRQVMFLYKAGDLFRVVSISSGSGRKYCEISKKSGKENCGDATTPRGNYEIQRRIPGWRESDLGKLYNPLYFTGGFAIHGAPSVPAGPASHGCIRITLGVAEWFPNEVANGTKVYVYD